MDSRSEVLSRITRRALVVSVGLALVAGLGAWRAAADFGDSAADCITGYHSEGMAGAFAQGVEIPQENVAAQPYATANLNDTPTSHARANNFYPGYIGQALYDTASNYTPDSPFAVEAWYPQPPKGKSADAHDDGPFAHTLAWAKPAESLADARTAFVAGGDQAAMGPSTAHVDMKYTGDLVQGLNQATAYNVTLGPLHIDVMKSAVSWKSDGTDQGTVATWTVQFHGVNIDGKRVAGSDANGFSLQGGAPAPGSASMEQTQTQEKQLSDALDKAGFAQAQVMAQPSTMRVEAGRIDMNGTALTLRIAPTSRRDNSGQAVSYQLGRTWLHVLVYRGSCDNVKAVPQGKTDTPPDGANLPPYPPQGDPYHWTVAPRPQEPPSPPGLPSPPGMPGLSGQSQPHASGGAAAPAPGSLLPLGLGRELQGIMGGTLPPTPSGTALH
jgi:hypothetical protein